MTDVEMAVGQGVEVNKHQDWDGVWVRCRGRRDLQPTAEMAFGRRAWADGRGYVWQRGTLGRGDGGNVEVVAMGAGAQRCVAHGGGDVVVVG
jgi:hypothetical protein